MKFAVIEVGSTNTRSYICENDIIREVFPTFIEFKNHYKSEKRIVEDDKQKLYECVKKISIETRDIYVYGTSIFRQLKEEERKSFLNEFKKKTGLDFHIVSPDEENDYTVYGVIANIDYNGILAVVIGGGGSTELAIIKNKKIIEKANSTFGAIDITHAFPDLKEDIVTSNFNSILAYTHTLVNKPKNKSDILVLAGGNYTQFYEALKYKVDKNSIYEDINQPYLLTKKVMDEYDIDFFYKKSLLRIKEECKKSIDENWWDGARGMRICIRAIADVIDAKYIIPTKITMVYGIVNKIKEENTTKVS